MICRPGGAIVLTIKTTLWDSGFAARIADLAPVVAIAERTEPYVSMPGEAGTIPSVKLPCPRARDGRTVRRVLVDLHDLDQLIDRSKETGGTG